MTLSNVATKLRLLSALVLLFGCGQLATQAMAQTTAKAPLEFSWDNASVYFLFVDRFRNGNPGNDQNYNRKTDYGSAQKNAATFHGGDIAGVIEKLEDGYFQRLGVSAIWVTGVYEQMHGWVGGGSRNDFPHYGYHGYYPMDFTSMDRNFGTIEEFRRFVDLAHGQGIRVIMDAGLNHPGYNTLLDAVQFGFGDVGLDEASAREHREGFDYLDLFQLSEKHQRDRWWGDDWTRAPDEVDKDLLTESIYGLPDFRTESTQPVAIPGFLRRKWQQEGDATPWVNPSAVPYRRDHSLAPADYVVQWLAAWVREFGIDGFRCDVIDNVDAQRWQQLHQAANAALGQWRRAHPESPASQWRDDFWMTGDVWDSDIRFYPQYAELGFDSIVNFTFPKSGDLSRIGDIWQQYADQLNNRADWSTLSFLNNTYKRDTNPADSIDLGTSLLLAPGAVQIFYGDEVARKADDLDGISDPIQNYRSDYDWDIQDLAVLAHWQKLGQFRRRHLAVGAGAQVRIAEQTFARVHAASGDKVIIKLSDRTRDRVAIGDTFAEGTRLRNAYTGEVQPVRDGYAEFRVLNRVLLLEALPNSRLEVEGKDSISDKSRK